MTEQNTDQKLVVNNKENRKTRRKNAALKRHSGVTKHTNQRQRAKTNIIHWQKRFLNEMKQNKSIQENIVNGKFDKILEKKQ